MFDVIDLHSVNIINGSALIIYDMFLNACIYAVDIFYSRKGINLTPTVIVVWIGHRLVIMRAGMGEYILYLFRAIDVPFDNAQ